MSLPGLPPKLSPRVERLRARLGARKRPQNAPVWGVGGGAKKPAVEAGPPKPKAKEGLTWSERKKLEEDKEKAEQEKKVAAAKAAPKAAAPVRRACTQE